jgi:hypothetical protein
MASQLLVLAGVIIGALASYLTTAAVERARWNRTLDSRWDDRRIEAYAAYAQAVKDIIRISTRLAAGRGYSVSDTSLPPTEENFDLLAAADTARGAAWEKVLLLGHPDTVIAARNWHESVWRLEWYAREELSGEREDWETARSAVNDARSKFYESARRDLQVTGGALPGPIDYDERLLRVRGEFLPTDPPEATANLRFDHYARFQVVMRRADRLYSLCNPSIPSREHALD